MTLKQAERLYKEYLDYIKDLPEGYLPARPRRDMMAALRKAALKAQEIKEYRRLRRKYGNKV